MNPDLRPPDAPDSKLALTILLKSCKLADLAMQQPLRIYRRRARAFIACAVMTIVLSAMKVIAVLACRCRQWEQHSFQVLCFRRWKHAAL